MSRMRNVGRQVKQMPGWSVCNVLSIMASVLECLECAYPVWIPIHFKASPSLSPDSLVVTWSKYQYASKSQVGEVKVIVLPARYNGGGMADQQAASPKPNSLSPRPS